MRVLGKEISRRDFVSVTGGAIAGTSVVHALTPLFGHARSSQAPEELQPSFDPTPYLKETMERTPLQQASAVPQRRRPAFVHKSGDLALGDLQPARMDLMLDYTDPEQPMIVGDYSEDELTRPYDPASLTKIIMAMVVVDHINAGRTAAGGELSWDMVVETTGTERRLNTRGSNDDINGAFRDMDEASVRNLMEMALIGSRNGACMTLARIVADQDGKKRSYRYFVQRMNEKAEELGMRGTYFINMNGLPHRDNQDRMNQSHIETPRNKVPNNVTTLEDLAKMSLGLQHPHYSEIERITSQVHYDLPGYRGQLSSSNPIIREERDFSEAMNCVGTKTGTTDAAGRCLISTAKPEIMGRNYNMVTISTGNSSLPGAGWECKRMHTAMHEDYVSLIHNQIVMDCQSAEEAEFRVEDFERQCLRFYDRNPGVPHPSV